LSRLLQDRIDALEGELKQIFQDDCDLIKDWGAPLDSCRKEFKNTSRSFDPLTLTIAITTLDELSGGCKYPTALSTPSESAQSPLFIGSLGEIDLPSLRFAGLEENQVFEMEDCWPSDRTSAGSSPPRTRSSLGCNDAGMEDMSTHGGDTIDMAGDLLIDWEQLFNSDQMTVADYQNQDLGNPTYWGSDLGNSDDALH
jgi:hypothetical protein